MYIFSYETFVKLTSKTYVVHFSDNTVLISSEDTSATTVRENLEFCCKQKLTVLSRDSQPILIFLFVYSCDKPNDQSNVGCNGNSSNTLVVDNDDSSCCSRASSPFDVSEEDDESDDTSSPHAIPPSSSDTVTVTPQHHRRFHQPHQHNYHHHHHHQQHHHGQGHHHHVLSKRKIHKIQPAAHQYKLRDSR